MQLFYHPSVAKEITLGESESQHCIKVLRHKSGDTIGVIDGKGKQFQGVITSDHPKKCEIAEIELSRSDPKPKSLHIAIAPTKNTERMEWFAEKATEIGVTEVTFLQCERSERPRINLDRINKKVLSALKQCQGLWLPKINSLTGFDEVVERTTESNKFIACLGEGTNHINGYLSKESIDQIILIGPEGDFTSAEINMAIDHEYHPVCLGRNVLRTETAGIVACSLLSQPGG